MSVCKNIQGWITEKVRKPFERWVERSKERCTKARKWVEETIRTPIENRRTRTEKKCKRRKCRRRCLCCNKWFCWFETIVERVIEWVIEVVGEWVVETLCKIVMSLVKITGEILITSLKWGIVGITCLFSCNSHDKI